MGTNPMTIIAAVLVLSNTLFVNGQYWCTGTGSQTLSKTANDGAVGYITSRYYPSPYSNNLDCTTTISTSGSNVILFYVDSDSIENYYDYLKIYSGSVSGSLLYNSDYESAPYVYLSSSTDLVADFHTDSSITYGGFRMYYVAVDRTILPSCGSTISATSNYQQLSYVDSSSQSSTCIWTITTTDTSGSYGVEVKVLLVKGTVSITSGGTTSYYYNADSVIIGGTYPSTVEVRGDYGNSFVVLYREVEVSSATGVVITTTSATDTSICSSSFRTSYENATQYLKSPNYPGQYYDNIFCQVTMVADNSSQSIFLNISDYEMAVYDTLFIFDGSSTDYNQLSQATLSTGSNFTSTGYSLTLLFTTNSYGQNRGFQLSYYSVERDIPVCDQSHTLEENVTASATEQVIESPSYPSYYSNNDDRYWLIVKPSESDNIVLDFRVFKVEEATECMYDDVSIFDGACTTDPLIAKVCGHNPVTFEDSTGLYILIHFHTDGSVTYTGWRLTYYIGTYQDPEASAATDGGTSSIKDYIYPIIGIAVITVIAITLFTCLYCKGRGRVGAGEAKSALKKRTTHDLLTELRNKYGSAETDKQPKIKRKGNNYHPEPNPPGPNVNVIQIGERSPHPPPGLTDPAFPPSFIGTGSQMPTENIAPVLTEQTNVTPSAPLPDALVPSKIPPPFVYLTPAEARAAGLYGQ